MHHRHAHGDAIGDLFENDASRPVGDFGGNFHVAVHRAGVHDDRVFGRVVEDGVVDLEEPDVFADAGEEAVLLAFNTKRRDTFLPGRAGSGFKSLESNLD
jgi:hypothetical protein